MLTILNQILWAIATAMILLSSLYFSYQLGFIQFNVIEMIRNLFKKKEGTGISPFQALMMVLAGRIGVGSIAGVALAIYLGGVGSIFWMWVIAILSAINAYCETVLGIIYKEKDQGDVYKGGPSYYIKKGLGNKTLGSIYAILILISYIGGFLGIQSNTIVKSIEEMIPIDPMIVGICIVILTALIIFGGVKKIADATSKIVPVMTLLYLLVAFYIICINIQLMPSILWSIVKGAFQFKSFFSGFIPTFIIGIQRGLFSNEAGLGTGSIASSTTDSGDPSTQGFVQMIGIYITTLLICTATAFIILTSNYTELVLGDINGIEITQYAFQFHLGNIGTWVVFLSIVLFSFSTILTGYYYGESSLKYLFIKMKPIYLLFLKLFTLLILFLGSIVSSGVLWKIVDLLVALLAIINTYALVNLRNEIKEELVIYKAKKCGKI